MIMLHIKLKLMMHAANMVANTLPTDTSSIRGWGQKVKPYFFSESSLVAYHIKGNPAQSTMEANMLSLHTPTTPGVESTGHIFLFEKWPCCISN